MRFSILGPRADAVTAAEVRALREARGWTVEQMAGAVHASPLEVSAWESGAVQAPPLQAARVRWMMEMDRRAAAVASAGVVPCDWVREHEPHLHDEMVADLAGNWYVRSHAIREHVAICPNCRARWTAVKRLGPAPAEPDEATFDTLRARYGRWVQRFPRWMRGPLNLLGWVPGLVIAGAAMLTLPDPDSGLAARLTGLSMGALIGFGGFLIARELMRMAFPRRPFIHGLVGGAVGISAGMSVWGATDASVQTGDPRFLAGAAVLSVAAGVWSSRRREPDEDTAFAQAEGGREGPASSEAPPLPPPREAGLEDLPRPRAEPVADPARRE